MRIRIDNNKSRLIGDRLIINEICRLTKIRVRNAFFAMRSNPRWDGYKRWVSEATGMFPTGMLPQIIKILKDEDEDVILEDTRDLFKEKFEIEGLGELKGRDYQIEAVQSILNNRVEGLRFQRGILHEATNAGKNLIAAMIFASFAQKRQGIFLIDEKEIFDQAVEELSTLLPDEIGYVSSKRTVIKRFNVCMVQTLASRMRRDNKLKTWLAQQDIVIVDEADKTGGSKTGQSILNAAFNATIRIALTGTAGLSKDKTRNQDIIAYFGPVVHQTTNKDLVEKGHSTPPIIKFFTGNAEYRFDGDYESEYGIGIMENKARNKRIWKRVWNSRKRLPCMIMFRHHKHGRLLLKSCPEKIKDKYVVKMVHGKTANRKSIINRFKEGKIDILICSKILTRGKNVPLTKMMINAAGGDSLAHVLQMFGRLLRKHHTKKEVLFIDFFDQGKYLQRHSKHRIAIMKKQGFPVKEIYKKRTIKKR